MAQINHNTLLVNGTKVSRDASDNVTITGSSGQSINLSFADLKSLVSEIESMDPSYNPQDEMKIPQGSPPAERQTSSQPRTTVRDGTVPVPASRDALSGHERTRLEKAEKSGSISKADQARLDADRVLKA